MKLSELRQASSLLEDRESEVEGMEKTAKAIRIDISFGDEIEMYGNIGDDDTWPREVKEILLSHYRIRIAAINEELRKLGVTEIDK